MNIHAQSDKYLEVKIKKSKKEVPTVIEWQGKTYILRPSSQGRKKREPSKTVRAPEASR